MMSSDEKLKNERHLWLNFGHLKQQSVSVFENALKRYDACHYSLGGLIADSVRGYDACVRPNAKSAACCNLMSSIAVSMALLSSLLTVTPSVRFARSAPLCNR